ncbi:hypothetical protein [Neoasaia chiangmaiensis]|uniref:hypothetical protein n=1 Tax=Neoasaia chiangmaiensis TaxID=320497 RepID=UPI0011BEB51A|nr:hypothetical protein [Neoasaia chiangmaiensis]
MLRPAIGTINPPAFTHRRKAGAPKVPLNTVRRIVFRSIPPNPENIAARQRNDQDRRALGLSAQALPAVICLIGGQSKHSSAMKLRQGATRKRNKSLYISALEGTDKTTLLILSDF